MEHGAPTKILPVEIIWRTATIPNFPVYLILATITSFSLTIFATILCAFLSLRGQVLFPTNAFFFKRNIQTQPCFSTWILTKFKSGWEKTMPTKWTDHPYGGNYYQVHKVDGSPIVWKFIIKPTKWTGTSEKEWNNWNPCGRFFIPGGRDVLKSIKGQIITQVYKVDEYSYDDSSKKGENDRPTDGRIYHEVQ